MPGLPLETAAAIRRAAMDLLARREHGRAELTRKLRQRGAAEEMIEAALDRLTEQGLLNEARYLAAFIASKARAGQGPLRIREELTQRGLQRSMIEEALRAADIDWPGYLKDVWQRRFDGQLPRDARERAQQGRFLAYRGYPVDMIARLLRGADHD
jgi:regulatory protein